MFKMHKGWLPEDERLALLEWVDQVMAMGIPHLDTHCNYGIQFRDRDPELYLRIGGPLEKVKERIRQEFGLRDHPDAYPGWKVWVSIIPLGGHLPMHQHLFREGCGDLRVNILLKKAAEGGLAGYIDEEHDPDEGDLWFLDGVKDHWVSEVKKGTRVLISFGFDIPQDEIDRMGV